MQHRIECAEACDAVLWSGFISVVELRVRCGQVPDVLCMTRGVRQGMF